jgi:hypothetical protein
MSEELNVTTPQVNESVMETTQESMETTTEQTPQQAFKVKHLHEEKEIGFDEAPTYIQKGLDYDRIKTKYEDSKPVIGFVEKLASQNGMTVPEYLKAVEEYERRQEIDNLANQRNLDPELAEELYLSRQERQQRKAQETQREMEERNKQEYVDFINEFPDVKPEDVPAEVWEMKNKNPNISISDAYIRYERNQLKAKLSATEVNQKNAETSTGSVTGNGSPKSMTLTPEMIDSMTDKERMARWPEIKKVLGMK